MIVLFLLTGLFLGWSLGANDAANVFGTAVGSKMIKFKKAAIVSSVFVVLGSLLGGKGTTETLNSLGKIAELQDSAIIAFSAAVVVLGMTWMKLPVSTSQSVVGGIIGWNIFYHVKTDTTILAKIVSTWIFSPVLSALAAILFYLFFKKVLFKMKLHLIIRDQIIRNSLLIIGAFGSYSLGANNIANVMGVFLHSSGFQEIILFSNFKISVAFQLYLLGGISIAVGILTYSKPVMLTVGRNLLKLSPEHALIVVFSHSVVLLLFSSVQLSEFLKHLGLPQIPLVPVSSTQAIIGAILGLGLIRSSNSLKFQKLGTIALGWVLAPLFTLIMCYLLLYILK